MSNEKNAKRGKLFELQFKNSIVNQRIIVDKLKIKLNIDQGAKIAKVYQTGGDLGKGDVAIRFDNKSTILANLKSFRLGLNQATRMNPFNFIDKFGVPDDIAKVLIDSLIRKSANPTKVPFIYGSDIEPIELFFANKASEIIRYSICGDEDPELFVMGNKNSNSVMIYVMKDLLNDMDNCIDVKVSKRGVIILNPYFRIQRKGGNGKHETHPKTSIKHGGNNIQVKIDTKNLANDLPPPFSYTTAM